MKASFRYGASKSTHRVDDVVSGRITPTCRLLAPLVAAAVSGLNWDIVDAMFTVKELMLSPAGTVAEPVDDEADVLAEEPTTPTRSTSRRVEDDELDDEQPAAVRATSAAVSPTQPSRRKPRMCGGLANGRTALPQF